MRQKRAKAYRKLMNVYCMSFGFRQPYQVLVDSKMCFEALSSKIDLSKQLAVVLQGTVKPMITQCCIHSLYIAGKAAQPAVDLAKTFERRRCNHREAIPEEECVKEVIGPSNKHRYVLATQSASLRQHTREIPGVPMVHVKRSVMVLEPASEATEKMKSMMEAERLKPSEAETSTIASTLAETNKSGSEATAPPKKKRRGPRGPNPLSAKKKKPKDNNRRPRSEKPREDTMDRSQIAGGKRKRSDDDHDADGQDESSGRLLGMEASDKRSKKRVRKRKRLAVSQLREDPGGDGHTNS